MVDVIKEIRTAISEFCRAQVVSKGGDRFAIEGKKVTAIYVSYECWHQLLDTKGPTGLSGNLADGFKFHQYDIFPVGYKNHPRVRVV